MDVNSLSTLISNIGVPCACLIATFYLWQKETDAHKEEMKNMTADQAWSYYQSAKSSMISSLGG